LAQVSPGLETGVGGQGAMAVPREWRMHTEGSPLLTEFLALAESSGWSDVVSSGDIEVQCGDALVVLDLQNDFVPVDEMNAHGGAVAVEEGPSTADLAVRLMDHFIAKGGIVVCTRDYHPQRHCSFNTSDGPYPVHCVQGSAGSHFYKPVGDCIQKHKRLLNRCQVAFKGVLEDVDSYGAFEYPDVGKTWERLSRKDSNPARRGGEGFSLLSWTGAFVLETSQKEDPNAPPDACAVLTRQPLAAWLHREGAQRVFVCGMGLCLGVLDTVVHGRSHGFETFMVLDASRAIHLPGVGGYGSGFLQDPAESQRQLVASGAQVIPAAALLPGFKAVGPTTTELIRVGFPGTFGPFSLVAATKIAILLDRKTLTYKVKAPMWLIRDMESRGIVMEGSFAKPCALTLDDEVKKRAGIPLKADEFCFVYPVGGGRLDDKARAYMSISTPSAAFFIYGGFIYLDKRGCIMKTFAISLGSGLSFSGPQPWRKEFTSALKDRWMPVTLPFVAEKGAKFFAWINPNEKLEAEFGQQLNVEPWVPSEHGGFVYLFTDDLLGRDLSDPRDAIYNVIESDEEHKSTPIGRVGCGEEDDEGFMSQIREQCEAENKEDSKAKVTDLFKAWDSDGSGKISEEELVNALRKLDDNLSESRIRGLFKAADVNRDGLIDTGEFISWIYDK